MATRILHLPKFGRINCSIKQCFSTRTFTTAIDKAGQKLTCTLNVEERTDIATLTLNRPPANALNAATMGEIQRIIVELEQSQCRGLILTSALERIFSAGLDLKECYKPDLANLEGLFRALQNLWRTLFFTPLITVALINGHAMAGGLLLAASSDYRIMLANSKIGLNDTMAGLTVPTFAMESYKNIISSKRIAELDLTSSRIYSSDEAFKVGLVDELVISKGEALEKSVAFINSFEQRTLAARSLTKQKLREQILNDFESNRQHDLDTFMNTITKPDVQAYLGEYLQSLKHRKQTKG